MGEWHPEAPARLKAVMAALETEEFTFLHRHEAPKGTLRQIERVHAPFYVEAVFENIPNHGHVHLDSDTAMNPFSGEAALRAVGGICAAVDAVANGEARNAFCAVRPPGHHAEIIGGDGLLLVQQRRCRGRACARSAWHGKSCRCRFRRAPRQRHAKPRFSLPRSVLRVEPPVALLSRDWHGT